MLAAFQEALALADGVDTGETRCQRNHRIRSREEECTKQRPSPPYKAGVRYSHMALSPVKTATKLVQPPMF